MLGYYTCYKDSDLEILTFHIILRKKGVLNYSDIQLLEGLL